MKREAVGGKDNVVSRIEKGKACVTSWFRYFCCRRMEDSEEMEEKKVCRQRTELIIKQKKQYENTSRNIKRFAATSS